jgi:hypothetical protein
MKSAGLARLIIAISTTGLLIACAPTASTPTPSPLGPSVPIASPTPAVSVSAIPSASVASASATAQAAQPCSGNDVLVTGGAGSRGSDITVQSKAGAACELPASPAVVALDAGGAVVAQGRVGAVGAGPALPAGASLKFSLEFSNWCNGSVQLPMHFALRLVSGSTQIEQLAITSADELPPCNGPGQPATLSTTNWES